MPPKTEKERPLKFVEVTSSDDEGGARTVATQKVCLVTTPPSPLQISGPDVPQSSGTIEPSGLPSDETLESRSFWKAGNYAAGPTSKPVLQGSLEHARVHPKFLHSNATSHKWAFGAIAELMDNAVDEIHHGATFLKVDKIDVMKDNSPALLFQDDGGGMDPELIRKCMSLGYSSKKSNTTIGQYGNGFKTSTMRLGADVIVFSRSIRASNATQSVGLLSYTFLRRTGLDDVIVPMIDFDISGHWAEPIIYSSQDDWSSNLKTILEWSPFASKEELLLQFDDIGPHGTKIVIYNLWLNDEGIYELAFDDDDEDIRLRDEALRGATKLHKKIAELQSHISYHILYSLRAYASMLYLRKFKNFQIILRGKPVQQFNIADELRYPKVVTYKPQVTTGLKECAVETTIGFIKEAPSLGVSGFNVYHKNRLIRPFWKVTGDGSSKGNGVVGVLEADFIEPAHDKQDFERSSLSVRLENRLKQMVADYWRNHCHLIGYQALVSSARDKQKGHPVQPPVVHAASMEKHSPSYQHNSSCNLQAEVDDQVVHIPGDGKQDLSDKQPGVEVPNGLMSEDDLGSMSVDQICEENIKLFGRCEEYRKEEAELKQTIDKLEKDLGEMRKKCAQISSLLEAKQKLKVK
ncbi:protein MICRORCHIDIA 2-like [Herrania umbratica]|uniref:Protein MICRORCHIDIA 2-like n=1 Tax=Herrania umbratica TaxID=108875 RepID=A0A6J0ZIJ4_9ROSI|nr:protein MICRORCHIDIA 2-like [Herrania umbratica]